MTELVAAWPDAVGETVAANAWPARLARDGTLHVHAALVDLGLRAAAARGGDRRRLREAVSARPRRPVCASLPGPLPELAAPAPPRTRDGRRRSRTLEQAREARELAAAIDVRRSPQIGRKSCADEPRKGR